MDTTNTIQTAVTNSIAEITNATTTFTISNGLLIWTAVIIVCLTIAVCFLTWLLFKKERALQLLSFSISPIGLKLSYELNNNEKIKLLIQDNLALKNEIKVLRTALNNAKFSSLIMAIIALVAFFLLWAYDKLMRDSTKDKVSDQNDL